MQSKRSVIGHRGMPFNCPHTEEFVCSLLRDLNLPPQARILDLGCGRLYLITALNYFQCAQYYVCMKSLHCRGELLRRAVQCGTDAVGIGVDNSPEMLAMWPEAPGLQLHQELCDLNDWIDEKLIKSTTTDKFDIIFCIGALPSGRQKEIACKLLALLKPKGRLVIGELTWMSEGPSQEFVDYVGVTKDDICSHDGLVCALVSGSDNYDVVLEKDFIQSLEHYETLLLKNVEEWASYNSDDEDAKKILSISREWTDFGRRCAWATWGFSTIVVILFPQADIDTAS